MTLDIPPGATVQIFVGGPPAQFSAFPASSDAPALSLPAAPARGRPLLKFAGVGVLAAAAFLSGRAIHPGSQPSLAAAGAFPAPSAYASPPVAPEAYARAFPDRVIPPAPIPPAMEPGNQIPSAFVQQLQQKPTITPPPGAAPAQAAGGPAVKHPFGLED